MSIINTRLYKTSLNQSYVVRPRLLDMFETCKEKPLILVVAGAGYGKSVTVSQWLDHSRMKYCWISLEKDCNDLRIVLSYIVSAVKTVYPSALSQVSDIIDAMHLPPNNTISQVLINDLDELAQPLNLVLDDYHFIRNPLVHSLINDITHYPPEKFKITLISRHDPPLNLSMLRTYDRICEIRMSDLKFSLDEIMELSSNTYNSIISAEFANTISTKTEGWIIGLRLFLKMHISSKKEKQYLIANNINNESLTEYLIEEILKHQTNMVQNGLMIASLFDRFSIALLRSVLKNEAESGFTYEIKQFINQSMFIYELDNQNNWFRFHHLIRDFLRELAHKKYTKDQIDLFYGLASNFFKTNNLLEESITCAVEGHRISKAIEIMSEHWDELLLRDQYSKLEQWIAMLPAGVTECYPNMIVLRVILNDAQANYPEMKRNLDKMEIMINPLDLHSKQSKKLWGEYHALRSGLNYFTGNIDHIIEHADQALELLSFTRSYFQDYAMLFKAFAFHISGKHDKAIRMYEEYLPTIPPDYHLGMMRSHSYLPLILIYQADIEALKSSARIIYQISNEEKSWVTYVMACKYLTTVHYIQNDLDKVEPYIHAAAKHHLAGRPLWVAHTLFFGVLSYLHSGQIDKMKKLTEEVYSFLKSFNVELFDDLAYSFQVELALRQNKLALAEKYAIKTRFNSIPIIFSFYFTQLTEVKLLIKRGDANSLKRAFELLELYVENGKSSHNRNFLLQAYILLAFYYKKVDEPEKVVHFIKEALEIGQPGNYLRMFADFGEEMKELLMHLHDNDRSNRFISNILHIIIEEDASRIANSMIERDYMKNSDDFNCLLTTRELEILVLVAQGFQNKEIANKLFYSLITVKKYLSNIYHKLGVKNRVSAITKARKLDLLPSLTEIEKNQNF